MKLLEFGKIVNDTSVPKSNQELVDEGILRLKEPFGYVDDQIQFYTVADLKRTWTICLP